MEYLLIIGGFALLAAGGETIIRSGVNLSLRLRVSKLLIGLFVIAAATSAPELVVAVYSALHGQPDIAVGNVVGSNIVNVLFVLAIAAFLFPLSSARDITSRDLVMLLAVTGLYVWIAHERHLINALEGRFFVGALVVYVLYAVVEERMKLAPVGTLKQNLETLESIELRPGLGGWAFDVAGLGLAIAALYGGADLLIEGVSRLAHALGIWEGIIGLTVVAAGTSLPELATAIVASLRRHPELVVGTIVGSNIFNILAVLGITAMVKPVVIDPEFVNFDHWVMLAASAVLVPLLLSRNRISRVESAMMMLSYGLYVAYRFGALDQFI